MTELPRLLVVTDRHQLPPGRTLAETVAAVAGVGSCMVVVRERDLTPAQRQRLVREVAEAVGPRDAVLATQLRAKEPMPAECPEVVGRSCHSASELRHARDEGCTYATVSPVAPSASKPGYGPALGAAGLSKVLDAAPNHPPVFALGGVTPDNAPVWLAAGAYGVAVMGPVMRARDPASVCAALLRAVAAAGA